MDKVKIINVKINDDIEDITKCLDNLNLNFKTLKKKVNYLKIKNDRINKILGIKEERKKLQYTTSGFVKPRPINNEEFYNFLKSIKPDIGDTISFSESTKLVFQYIYDNNLRDPIDRRKINPDDTLKKLLGINDTIELTYFNIQHYLKPLR